MNVLNRLNTRIPGLLGGLPDDEQRQIAREYQRKRLGDAIAAMGGVHPGATQNFLAQQQEMMMHRQQQQEAMQRQQQFDQYLGMRQDLTPVQAEKLRLLGPDKGLEFLTTQTKMGTGDMLTDAFGRQIARNPTTQTLQLQEALAERDQHPFGSPMWDAWDRQARKLTEHSPQVAINLGDQGPQIGSIPPGYQAVQTPDGGWTMQVVPGSPVEREQETARQQQAAVGGFTLRDARILGELVDDMVGNPILRLGRAQIPGTPEARAKQFMDSLRGTVAIEQLLNIKRQGAGLGQVPQAQLDMLSFLMGKLDLGLPKEDLHMIIGDIQTRYAEILSHMTPEDMALVGIADREMKALTEQREQKAEPPAVPEVPVPGERPVVRSQEDYDALPSGTIFRDPEGRMRRKP